MTLRARLAIGLAFMAAVMAVGAYAVVRTIADSQHRQIDALISDAVPDIARVVPTTGQARGVLDSVVFGQMYVARLDPGGRRVELASPQADDDARPLVPTHPVGT